jgi:hypothetical protein
LNFSKQFPRQSKSLCSLQDIVNLDSAVRDDFLKQQAGTISGINELRVFVGSHLSTFPAHVEDGNFGSFIVVYCGEKVGFYF